MDASETTVQFTVWGTDHAPYGPVELPRLVDWVKDERVTADTWIYLEHEQAWRRAGEMAELQLFFPRNAPHPPSLNPRQPDALGPANAPSVKPGTLRRVKILSEFSDADLERFLRFMEVLNVRQWTQLVRQGDVGDAMFLVLEGELRVRLMIDGREKILATLGVGNFFGEMALFDHGPRSADVLANQDSLLLKITSRAFAQLTREVPELASPFLLAVGRTMTARIRADNKRYHDSVAWAQHAA